MKSSVGTEALLALEDAQPDILFSSFPNSNILAWPLLRGLVTISTAETELGTYPLSPTWTNSALLKRAARAMLPNLAASARMRTQRNALFLVDGGTYIQTATGRSNWLIEDHATAIADDAVVLQTLPIDGFTPRDHRPTFTPTYSFEDAVFRVEVSRRLAPPSQSDQVFVRSFVREIYGQLDFPVDARRIDQSERQLLRRFARARFTRNYLSRVLDRVQPKVVFMQTAAYGDRSHLISLLKDRSVYVAEHQHGWVGPSHGAYNFGAAMRTPELMRTLPDALLTFGDFWSDSVRFPGAKVAIGKPYLERAVTTLSDPAQPRRAVLVVSSASHREEVTRFTRALRDALPAQWQVLFRPHPSERTTVESLYPGLTNQARVSFDLVPDVYSSFAKVSGVFGTASTVLYEALAFGTAVYVTASPLTELYMDESLFGPPVADDEQLAKAVHQIVSGDNRSLGLSTDQLQRVWKPNSVQNFTDFYASLA